MKRKNKIVATTIASLAIFTSFLDINKVQASTSKTQVIKFSESARYRSQTINILSNKFIF